MKNLHQKGLVAMSEMLMVGTVLCLPLPLGTGIESVWNSPG